MAYTIIFMRRDSTDSAPVTFTLSKVLFWLFAFASVLVPVGGFFVASFVLAPKYMQQEGVNVAKQLKQTTTQLKELTADYNKLATNHKNLEQQLSLEKEEHAKVQARVAIVESAHMEGVNKFQQLQEEAETLRSQVSFYEKFVKPVTDREDLQCFNITTKESSNGVKYGVNFMRTEQKPKEKITRTVKMKILTGVDMIDLRTQEQGDADVVRTMTLTKSITLSGTIKTKLANEGLRILDIKAYDEKNNVTAHCWKAF